MKRLVLVTLVYFVLPAAPAVGQQKAPPPPPPSPIYDNGGFPDLLIDTARLTGSLVTETRTFSSTSCEMVEGSIGAPGSRRLLRFDVAIPNLGNADLVIGSPTDPNNPYASLFHYSPCHQHYHIDGFTDYQLLNLDRSVAATGHKQAFCLEDLTRFSGKGPSHGYTCSNQGITSGWADVYSRYLSGQWVDITGVPAGDYILRVVINAAGSFPENQNRYSNIFEVAVRITAQNSGK